MRVAKEFSRFATTYNQLNIIQKKVARELILSLKSKEYNRVLDIGCGSGEIYNNLMENGILLKHLTAIDVSKEMLNLHPKNSKISLIEGDFSRDKIFKNLPFKRYDITISSSAIQWSSNLDITIKNISKISKEVSFAIFTSGTFSTLHQCANIDSPIYSKEYLEEKIDIYFNASFRVVQYKLNFDSVYEMLRYIKMSGVSGGESKLSIRDIKRVIKEYPLNYLEFEIIFVNGISKN